MISRAGWGNAARLGLMVFFLGGLILLSLGGALDQISLARELAGRGERFMNEFRDHLFITGLSVGFSCLMGVPLGILIYKRARIRTAAFSVLNMIQTLPSLALFGLLIAPLAFISAEWPLLRELGIRGIGWAPAVIALTLYALLPIVRNTFSGFSAVDAGVIDAGRGMGMGRAQMFFKVELPLAAPIILNGLRIAGVQNIGNTAVAALIGAGGFGVFIFQGLGQSAIDLVLLGAVPTILLAVACDFAFQFVIKLLSPRGMP
jgi:osmoprotectant transport system permease protein